MSECPACGGRPFTGFGFNRDTGKMDVRVEVLHLCPVRANKGEYEDCLCCHECMMEQRICHQKPAA